MVKVVSGLTCASGGDGASALTVHFAPVPDPYHEDHELAALALIAIE